MTMYSMLRDADAVCRAYMYTAPVRVVVARARPRLVADPYLRTIFCTSTQDFDSRFTFLSFFFRFRSAFSSAVSPSCRFRFFSSFASPS